MTMPSLTPWAQEQSKPNATSKAGLVAASFHVLAVDDSNLDRKVVERILKKEHCRVTAVPDAFEAMKMLGLLEGGPSKLQRYDLIITDYSMPGMSGEEFLVKVKEQSSLQHVPVVLLSSETEPTKVNSCLAQGAMDYLAKPVQWVDIKRLWSMLPCVSRVDTVATNIRQLRFDCGDARDQEQPGLALDSSCQRLVGLERTGGACPLMFHLDMGTVNGLGGSATLP